MSSSVTVSFEQFAPVSTAGRLPFCAPLQVQQILVEKGITRLIVTGLPRDDFSTSVEDDAYELLNAYFNLERLAGGDDFKTHSAYLGDGAMVIIARCDDDAVKIEIESAPMLNKSLAYTRSLTTTLTNYLQAWRHVVGRIVDAAR